MIKNFKAFLNESRVPESDLYWKMRNKSKKFNLILHTGIDHLLAGSIFYAEMTKRGFKLNKLSYVDFDEDKCLNINLIQPVKSDIDFNAIEDKNLMYNTVCNFFNINADTNLAKIIMAKNMYDVIPDLLELKDINIKYLGNLVKTIDTLLKSLNESEFKTLLTTIDLSIESIFDNCKPYVDKLKHADKNNIFIDCEKFTQIYKNCVVFPQNLKLNLYIIQKYIREKELTNDWYIFYKHSFICIWGEDLDKLQNIFDGWDWYKKNDYLVFRDATLDELLDKLN